jgi:hypothetical protein
VAGLNFFQLQRLLLVSHFFDRLRKPEMKLTGDHIENIEIGFSARKRQIAAGVAVKIKNIGLLIQHYRRGGIFLQNSLFNQFSHPVALLRLLQLGILGSFRSGFPIRLFVTLQSRHRKIKHPAGSEILAPEYFGLFIQGDKQT